MSLGTLVSLIASTLLLLGMGAPVRADDYPLPTSGQGAVSASSAHPGECVTFSGDGFAPGAVITVRDNGQTVGTTTSDSTGHFSRQVCFATDAELGAHELTGTGLGANGATRTVRARVTLVGAQISGNGGGNASGSPGGSSSGGAPGSGSGLPFTGANIRDLIVAGSALLLAGGVLSFRGRNSRHARRRARLAN